MKLTKTNQKIDNNICKALTIACESSLHDIAGFVWLTHRANYTNFPASLVITCVFNSNDDIEAMKAQHQDEQLRLTIQKQLVKVGVVVKNIKQSVHFDSEEACQQQHRGEWDTRLALRVIKQKPNAGKVH
ncbi:Fis family transcriptional regulator [Colwellia ponticola]|uniref:Fis family transcriptional regulator n=1 Tax=Colwellia ponticola TaxID=2304625 RepID=A0A8H2JNE4_9GAMM|nr:Fis family transcriptional regulator [Colwellia ponticola]TMM45441.1 Fis family transcriptional regulator [Colwellia ponticola]